MTYLALSILSATLLIVIFKYFGRYGVDNFTAITVNYLVAAGVGFAIKPAFDIVALPDQPWFTGALIIGIFFFFMFLLIALTAQKIGVAVASVASKMSLVIPVVFAVILYSDPMPLLKIAGIVLALAGVYMATKASKIQRIDRKYIYLPLILFLGNGAIDTFIKYTQHYYVPQAQVTTFVPHVFLISGVTGLLFCVVTGKLRFSAKNLLWGLALGVPNYFSIYFLMKALGSMQSSVVFPINNMGIVAVSAIAAFILFRENLSRLNWAGILLSLVAIALIAVA